MTATWVLEGMANSTRTHSRLVGLLKILLPLIALAIFSSLFLIADRIDPDDQLALADLDVGEVLARPGITNPSFAGQTETGEAIRLKAQVIEPEPDGTLTARGLLFSMTQTDGGTLDVTAELGKIPAGNGAVEFVGSVMVATSSGLVIETQNLQAARDMGWMTAEGGVQANAPFGKFVSGALQIERTQAEDGTASYRAVFKDGVKLVYEPKD